MRFLPLTLQVELDIANPEKVISGFPGTYFYREGNDRFYLIRNNVHQRIDVKKRSFTLAYRNQPWFPTIQNDEIVFSNPYELWIKQGEGNNAIGWKFIAYKSLKLEELVSRSPTPTPTVTPTISVTPSITPSISITPSPTPTLTSTVTPTVTATTTPTPTVTPSITPSISTALSPTPTLTSTVTPTVTSTTTPTPMTTSFPAGDYIVTSQNTTPSSSGYSESLEFSSVPPTRTVRVSFNSLYLVGGEFINLSTIIPSPSDLTGTLLSVKIDAHFSDETERNVIDFPNNRDQVDGGINDSWASDLTVLIAGASGATVYYPISYEIGGATSFGANVEVAWTEEDPVNEESIVDTYTLPSGGYNITSESVLLGHGFSAGVGISFGVWSGYVEFTFQE